MLQVFFFLFNHFYVHIYALSLGGVNKQYLRRASHDLNYWRGLSLYWIILVSIQTLQITTEEWEDQNIVIPTVIPGVSVCMLFCFSDFTLMQTLSLSGVENGDCEKPTLAFFFASLRHFDFFKCKTATWKCFKCELEKFAFLHVQTSFIYKKQMILENCITLAKNQDCEVCPWLLKNKPTRPVKFGLTHGFWN